MPILAAAGLQIRPSGASGGGAASRHCCCSLRCKGHGPEPNNRASIGNEGEADGLSSYVLYTLERDFKFTSLNTVADNGKITFSWVHNSIKDASGTKTYKLYVQRSADGGTTWTDVRTDNI